MSQEFQENAKICERTHSKRFHNSLSCQSPPVRSCFQSLYLLAKGKRRMTLKHRVTTSGVFEVRARLTLTLSRPLETREREKKRVLCQAILRLNLYAETQMQMTLVLKDSPLAPRINKKTGVLKCSLLLLKSKPIWLVYVAS